MKKYHENEEVVLEQPIPYRSPIDPLDRIAVLGHPKTTFTPCFDPEPKTDSVRLATFFAERGWDMHEIFQQRARKSGELEYELTPRAVGELGRACRRNPNLFREIYGREMPS